MMSPNILILVPGKNARGGITNYYQSLRKQLPKTYIYFERGSRNWPVRENTFKVFIRLFSDYVLYIYYLLFRNISTIQTTTAFYKGAIIRDGIFIIFAKILRKKVVVFFRGWNDQYAHSLSGLSLKLFKIVYFSANAIIDLSEQNVNFLRNLGYNKPIYLETTVVDEDLLTDVEVDKLILKRHSSKKKTILFLSRIEKEKGIYKLLETYTALSKKDDKYVLIYAGDGTELENLKKIVHKDRIPDVEILGFVEGQDKVKLFKEASIFVFLSDFEGMPNAVLEAMAFGIPIISTNVGGIASIFTNLRNGYLIDSYKKDDLISKIESVFDDDEFYFRLSNQNYQDAKYKVMSDIVAKRMINIFEEIGG